MASNWILNQDHRSDFEVDGSKVTFKYNPNQSQYFNAMYLGLCANEKNRKYYWEFHTCSDCSVGITKKESFNDGFKLSGAFFNGNLSNGSCLLVGEFGDFIKDGDKIGMILDLGEKELKVYIVQNGRPLGLAFLQSAPYAKELYPTISFSSPGSVEVNEKDATNVENLLIRSDYLTKTIDGKYKLVKFIEGSDERSYSDYQLTLKSNKKDNSKIHLSISVINTIGCVLNKIGNDEEGDIWKAEGLMSTLMAGDPKKMEDEFVLSNVLQNTKRIKFNENLDEVSLMTTNTKLHFKRFLPFKQPYQSSTLLK